MIEYISQPLRVLLKGKTLGAKIDILWFKLVWFFRPHIIIKQDKK